MNTTISEATTRGRVVATPKFLSPPVFNPCGGNPIQYMRIYEKTAVVNGWSDTHKIAYFECFMEGAAAVWVADYTSRDENHNKKWLDLKKDFLREFGGEDHERVLKLKFDARHQGAGEDLKYYYFDMVALANEVNPKMPFEMFRDKFEAGMHPTFRHTYYVLGCDIKNFVELKDVVFKVSNIWTKINFCEKTEEPLSLLTLEGNIRKNDSWNRDKSREYARTFEYDKTVSFRDSQITLLNENEKCGSNSKILTLKGVGNDRYIDIVIDTGSAGNLVSRNVVEGRKINTSHRTTILSTGGDRTSMLGIAKVKIELGNFKTEIDAIVVEKLPKPVILGTEFLHKFRACVNFDEGSIKLRNGFNKVTLHFDTKEHEFSKSFVAKQVKGMKHSVSRMTRSPVNANVTVVDMMCRFRFTSSAHAPF
ncbi:uncharacterized protein LOC107398436 [Tribolium castaneum]|uniref:Retrotransposon gag domain-containing protein n=1 Tax=Tribolium castaneum TaxID=7070 RepID=D7EKH9_TRICA|nr:PREDICTED: uncharacterized protein LOC107398436 [Tribolium castaneum]EFA13152.1 hypothetical protein TcasGA2_TC006949 [Tribolium castaneum]|eukprot:XP_015837962.1 PREDICTED: uncharacterized protein LOC107398436 [Tribolium castaneum]